MRLSGPARPSLLSLCCASTTSPWRAGDGHGEGVHLARPRAGLDFTTALSSGPGAADGNDFQSTSGTRTFSAGGPLFKTIPVTIKSGLPNEGVETFRVVAQPASERRRFGDPEAVVSIVDLEIDPCLINPHLPGCEFPLPPTS